MERPHSAVCSKPQIPCESSIHFTCPNEDGHSTPATDDGCCMVTNASEGDGFTALCPQQGCEEMSGEDCVCYIDQWCQRYGVTDAMDLVQWAETADAIQQTIFRSWFSTPQTRSDPTTS